MRYKIFVIISLLSVVVYANFIPNGFVYDDDMYVVENTHIRSIKNIPASFVHPEYLTSLEHKSHYRPLVMVSYTINYWISGLNPVAYRITNLLFHIGTSFMLFLTVEAMLGNSKQVAGSRKNESESGSREHSADNGFRGFPGTRYLRSATFIALTAALIFAVHPFNSEAVNYITARSSLMSGLFYISALYCWVRYREVAGCRKNESVSGSSEHSASNGFRGFPATYYILSLFVFLLGVLSKEVVVTLPLALCLYDILFRRTLLHSWRTYMAYIPFILLIPIALVVRSVYEGGGIIPFIRRDIATQMFTGIPVLTGYLKLMFLPSGLNVAHDVEIYNTPFALSVIISAVILLLYIINAVYLGIRREAELRLLSFFMIWYFISLLIIIIMPLNRMMQENRGYISGAVFAMFLGVVIWGIAYNRNRQKIAYGILVFLMIIYGVGTVYRNAVWKSNVTLWTDAMNKSPYEPLTYNNLSVALKDSGEYEKAKGVLYRGLRLSPNEWLYHYNLAILYKISGDLDHALLEYDRAIMIDPSVQSAYVGKGSIYLERGETGKGMAIFQNVIKGYPEYAFARYYMAKAYHKLGRTEDAGEELGLALQYAVKTHDQKLARRIAKFKNEGLFEEGIAPEDLIVNQ